MFYFFGEIDWPEKKKKKPARKACRTMTSVKSFVFNAFQYWKRAKNLNWLGADQLPIYWNPLNSNLSSGKKEDLSPELPYSVMYASINLIK